MDRPFLPMVFSKAEVVALCTRMTQSGRTFSVVSQYIRAIRVFRVQKEDFAKRS